MKLHHKGTLVIIGLALFFAGLCLSLAAQPGPPPPRQQPPDQPGRPDRQEMGMRRRGTRREKTPEMQIKAFMESLQKEDPEKYERLRQLHETNRQEFFREIRGMLRQRLGERFGKRAPGRNSPQEARCQELAALYHQTKDPAEKERIRKELEAAVQEAFEARLKNARERLERLEKQLEKFRSHIKKLETNREKIVETRMEELLRPPEWNWNSKW